MSQRAPPLLPRDNETPKGSRAIRRTESEQELEGGPKTKEGRAFITLKNKI